MALEIQRANQSKKSADEPQGTTAEVVESLGKMTPDDAKMLAQAIMAKFSPDKEQLGEIEDLGDIEFADGLEDPIPPEPEYDEPDIAAIVARTRK